MRAAGLGILIGVASLFACRADHDAPAPVQAPTASAPIVAPRSIDAAAAAAAAAPPAVDPWAAKPPNPDDPPDLGTRHALADKTCPTVAAPYFYKIVKGDAVSYILGTRHLGVPLAKFPASVRDRVAEAKLAVFEIAPGDDADLKLPDRDLAADLGPALWTRYVELVGPATADQVRYGRPDAALLMIMAMYEDITASLDNQVIAAVQAAKIPTQGLEKSVFQDQLLDQLLDERMLRAMVTVTKSRDEVKQDSVDDLAQYCSGTDHQPGTDAKQRAQMLSVGYTAAEIDKMDDVLVFARNRDWIPKLEPLLAKGGVLIAVGADHLIGDKGVVALLGKRGFTVTRVAP